MPKDASQEDMQTISVHSATRMSTRALQSSKPAANRGGTLAAARPLTTKSSRKLTPPANLPTPASSSLVEATLSSLETDTMGDSWYDVLKPEFEKPYFQKLKEFLVTEHKSSTIYPAIDNIYSWSRLTPLDSVKVVILGQDPYHNVGQAHGLSFSVLPPTKLPGSLRNIYKQISADLPSFVAPLTGDLTPLAKQGVLWLNTCLTVRAHKPMSHANKGWETFTEQVIQAVLANERGVVFLAWGLPAQKTCTRIGIDETKHLVLRSPHPSPLSAHRGFIGNGHFRKSNEWLREKYGAAGEIDWTAVGT